MSLNDINTLSTTSVWKSFGFSSNMCCSLSSSCVCRGGRGGMLVRRGEGRGEGWERRVAWAKSKGEEGMGGGVGEGGVYRRRGGMRQSWRTE